MPLLAKFLGGVLTAFAAFLFRLFGVKITARLLAVAAIAAAGVSLLAIFNGLVAPLAASAFSTSYGQVLGLAFPPVAGTCLAAFITTWVGCTAYALKAKAIRVTASV
jgi:hypothetical protein